MAEGTQTQVHPGSFVGDTVEEFKKLPTWGKFLALGAVGVVVYLAIRARQNSALSANQAAAGTLSGTAGSQSPFPNVNGTPLVPPGVTPIFDSNGNLIGWNNGTQPGNGTVNVPPATQPPAPPPPPAPPKPPPPTDKTWYYKKNGITYHAWHGADGRIWGNTGPGTKQVLLAGPAPGKKNGTGSGPHGTAAFMENPLVYWASADPHKPSSVRS